MKDHFTELIKQSDIDLRVWIWIKWIFISILLLVLLYVLFNEYSKGNCSAFYNDINKQYEGIVVDKYLNERNHMNETIILDNGGKHTINSFDKTSFYDSISIGDMVIKNKGSLKYFLIKQSDTLVFENKEPDCDKFLKK